jgi:uncharacterized membrane protein
MAAFFSNLKRVVVLAFVLAVIVYLIVAHTMITGDFWQTAGFWMFVFRWLHVISGVMWIGLLWYFNFVQTPGMPKIPADQKPAVTKVIAPSALFWFRWGAMATLVTGLLLAFATGGLQYIIDAYSLDANHRVIGIGMWFATIMWFNVWFLIWPNQKKVLGIVQADADAVANAGRVAGIASRINTLLSVAMLLCMVGQSHLG